MTSNSSLLKVTAVSKSFEGVRAVRDVSLTVEPGAIHALVGENGAGKSTLIKIMNGVYAPDSGVIAVNDVEVRFSGPQDAIAAGISTVPRNAFSCPSCRSPRTSSCTPPR